MWEATVAFSPDSRFILSASGSTLNLWNVSIGKLVRTFDGEAVVNSVAFSPDGDGDRGGVAQARGDPLAEGCEQPDAAIAQAQVHVGRLARCHPFQRKRTLVWCRGLQMASTSSRGPRRALMCDG
jgi:hypothetical protein